MAKPADVAGPMQCRVCHGGAMGDTHVAREMMFGTRETFRYAECRACGCLSIIEIATDLERRYGDGYYSMSTAPARWNDVARNYLKQKRAVHLSGRRTGIGWAATKLFGTPEHWRWLHVARADFDTRIVDVGCGSGALLRVLRDEGFRDLTGIDPFIPEPVEEERLRILKAHAAETRETFDLVMLNHSLEHFPDQDEAMQAVRLLVRPGGRVLVRIPVVGWAWRTYGVDWVQLDAPRHVVIHTEKSFGMLAERAGFAITRIDYDSTEFQFWGSEQYRRDVPLHDPRSCHANRAHPLFTEREMSSFRAAARDLNERRDGDQACFYLRPL